MKPLILLILLSLLPSACAQNTGPASSEGSSPTRAAAEEDIAEAVFRYQFDHNASGIQKQAARYCLSLPGERSPGEAFLQRFQGNQPPVASAEECERVGGKNLFFRVQRFDWRKDNEVWVRGGYYEGNLSSSVEAFQVVRQNGRWVVKGARMEMIS
ncbi:MAG TPA: hypothetical protein VIW92_06020 [Thermoanaerobaculia bacterium]